MEEKRNEEKRRERALVMLVIFTSVVSTYCVLDNSTHK